MTGFPLEFLFSQLHVLTLQQFINDSSDFSLLALVSVEISYGVSPLCLVSVALWLHLFVSPVMWTAAPLCPSFSYRFKKKRVDGIYMLSIFMINFNFCVFHFISFWNVNIIIFRSIVQWIDSFLLVRMKQQLSSLLR